MRVVGDLCLVRAEAAAAVAAAVVWVDGVMHDGCVWLLVGQVAFAGTGWCCSGGCWEQEFEQLWC